ncbi:hypothetical protein Tco_0737079, partial [Tanacetum coccineum]
YRRKARGLGESWRLGGLKLGYRPQNELIGFCEDCDDTISKLQTAFKQWQQEMSPGAQEGTKPQP